MLYTVSQKGISTCLVEKYDTREAMNIKKWLLVCIFLSLGLVGCNAKTADTLKMPSAK